MLHSYKLGQGWQLKQFSVAHLAELIWTPLQPALDDTMGSSMQALSRFSTWNCYSAGNSKYRQLDLDTSSLKLYWNMVQKFGGETLWRRLLHVLRDVADKHHTSVASVATKWVMSQGGGGIAYPIIGDIWQYQRTHGPLLTQSHIGSTVKPPLRGHPTWGHVHQEMADLWDNILELGVIAAPWVDEFH